MLKGEEDTFESLFDKLVSLGSVEHRLRLDDKPVHTGTRRERDPHSLEVDAWAVVDSRCLTGARMSHVGFATALGHMGRDSFFNKGNCKDNGKSGKKHRKVAREVFFFCG